MYYGFDIVYDFWRSFNGTYMLSTTFSQSWKTKEGMESEIFFVEGV